MGWKMYVIAAIFNSFEMYFLNQFRLIDRWQRTRGMTVRESANDAISPEAVRDNWDTITDFKNPLYPEGKEVILTINVLSNR